MTTLEKSHLSVAEVAHHFGINASTVYRLAQQGVLPGFKLGGQWRFNRGMLESWVADRTTAEWLRAEGRREGAA